jgi:hypothetical protein
VGDPRKLNTSQSVNMVVCIVDPTVKTITTLI